MSGLDMRVDHRDNRERYEQAKANAEAAGTTMSQVYRQATEYWAGPDLTVETVEGRHRRVEA